MDIRTVYSVAENLEKEAIRNVKLHWLLEGLALNYHNISDFRKINPKALKTTFKLFVLFLKDTQLITDEVVGMDGKKYGQTTAKRVTIVQKSSAAFGLY